jgi:hypothetical protein
MPRITLSCISLKNTQQTMSVDDLKLKYLFGLPLEKDGQPIPEEVYEFYLDAAVQQVEELLSLKLNKTVIEEQKDFYYDDWVHWSYIKASYPVVYPRFLRGFLGTTKQVDYPQSWLQARKTNDGKLYSRMLYMVPTYNSTTSQNSIIFSGVMPNLNWFASRGANGQIPSYWNMTYITGFDRVPSDIIHIIGMLASIQILIVLSDVLMGNNSGDESGMGWGINSKSVSIDGLSQSLSSGAGTGIFNARVKMYTQQLGDLSGRQPGELQRLIDYYNAIAMTCA